MRAGAPTHELHLPTLPREFRDVCGEFISHKVSSDYFLLNFIDLLIEKRERQTDLIRIAQALYFMEPVSGDG